MLLDKFMGINSRFMPHRIRTLFHKILPSMCILCGNNNQTAHAICSGCLHDLPQLTRCCPQCARFLFTEVSMALPCGTCLQHPPPFDRTYALFPYTAPIMQLIIQLKFQGQLSHARAFSQLLIARIQTEWYAKEPLPDVIIPVPLHPKRLRERGFNQALEIVKPIAKALALPIDFTGVKRCKHTAAQSSLPANLRRENIADAFVVTRDYSNLTLALVDDVITTASTVTEISRLLKQQGAKRIDVWCCARSNIALKPKTR